jgi:two-component system NtrC family sensor kinase
MLPTAKAMPPESAELDSGMMLSAAVPVRGPNGQLVGVLRAGTLLSRNYELVDQVQNTVFRGELYRGKPLGTATVFQHDARISTNVLRQDGSRAIGTRVSAEVHRHVLDQGKEWLGRAWVVNDWYVSAYAPILDVDRKPIGMLYVGVLQRKFRDVALRTLAIFALVTMAVLLLAGLAAWKLADSISRPVRALARATEAVGRGDFSETLAAESSDEISALTRTFNAMAESLRERDELLKQRTRLQLTRSERLAAVGRLAAGTAHEINNPLTGVLTFSHMLLRDAPENSQQREDIEAIIDATTRCRDIVRGLLNFSRQNEPKKRLSNLNEVLGEALNLTRNQAHLHRVAIVEELDANLPELVIDPYQIQEVAVNTILNAVDAMSDGGTLTVRTRAVGGDGRGAEEEPGRWAEFEISDTGCGIPAENLEHIFDPFFTTKPPGKGTGLGLAISYGIVTEHGGEIDVCSEPGRGTTVTVRLPAVPEE